jgi:hypothetical protein
VIHDAQDGTTGRTVWAVMHPDFARPVHVIAQSADVAVAYVVARIDRLDPDLCTTTDRGSADRTEIALWRDETRLPNAPTDPTPERGAL